jgi:hypothetical protein
MVVLRAVKTPADIMQVEAALTVSQITERTQETG